MSNLFDDDAERVILAQMLSFKAVIPNIRGAVQAQDFFNAANQRVFKAMCSLLDEYGAIDSVSLETKLGKREGDREFIQELMDTAATAANWKYYTKRVKKFSQVRGVRALAEELLRVSVDNVDTTLSEALTKGTELANESGGQTIRSVKQIIPEVIGKIEEAFKNKGQLIGLDTRISGINDALDGWPNDYIIIGARPSMGKAQPLDAKIKTVDGWKRMGDIQVGDSLASVDGKPSRVVGVFPQGVKDIYRIELSDGRYTECCGDHLWDVTNSRWTEKNKTVDTNFLLKAMKASRNRKRIELPVVDGNFGKDHGLCVDPWFLGFYLGDGFMKGSVPMFSNNDKENIDRVKKLFSAGHRIVQHNKYDYSIVKKQKGGRSDLSLSLELLGLKGTNSFTKFIPENYKESSRKTRVQLLSGMISTDGDVGKNGTISYTSVSETLIDDLVYVARSLGCICEKKSRVTKYTSHGERIDGAVSYRIHILMSNELKKEVLFLKRHRERINERRTRKNLLTIKSIKYVGAKEAQCIMVSHKRHLYITDDFIVTHNTALAGTLMSNIATPNIPVGFVTIEMRDYKIVMRMISSATGINSRSMRTGFLTQVNFAQIQDACSTLYEKQMYFDDASTDLEYMKQTCRTMARVHGVKAIFIDHASMITVDDSTQHWEKMIRVSKTVKSLQRELNIPMTLLCQLKTDAEGRKPTMADLRGSGSFAEDADTILLLNRDRVETKGVPGIVIPSELDVVKARDGEIGVIPLSFLPQTNKFCDPPKKP